MIDAANKQLRAVLIQAGHRLMRTSGRWGQLGRSLKMRGKATNIAVAAVANRWVRAMHHQMIAKVEDPTRMIAQIEDATKRVIDQAPA